MTPIVVEKRIAASPQTVYRYLTEPDRLAQWFGIGCTLEPSVDGAFEMRSPNGMTATGRVIDVVDAERISFTWGWEGHPTVPPGSTVVDITLIPDGDDTLVRLTHRDLDPSDQAIHQRGWMHYLSRLSMAAVGGDPGVDPGAG